MRAAGSTPSVIAYGDATFPKGTAFGGGGKVPGIAQRRPLGGAVAQRLRGSFPHTEPLEHLFDDGFRGVFAGQVAEGVQCVVHAD